MVEEQFSGFGNLPWFITTIPRESYIKKEWEENPFIKVLYLPNCYYVGSNNMVKSMMPFEISDDEYPATEISDEEFIQLRKSFKPQK